MMPRRSGTRSANWCRRRSGPKSPERALREVLRHPRRVRAALGLAAAALIRRVSKSRGVIFTLHRVLPDDPADFSPNAILQVKPDYLEFVIQRDPRAGNRHRRPRRGHPPHRNATSHRPFVVFTFDDAYRDNLRYALPVLRRQQCPFTLYVPTALVDGVGEVWWQALEDIIAGCRMRSR